MKLKLLLLLCLFSLKSSVYANINQPELIVYFQDSKQIRYALHENPELSFSNNDMIIQTSSTKAIHSMDAILKITYDNIAGLHANEVHNSQSPYSLDGEYIIISYPVKDTHLEVYNLEGKLVMSKFIVKSDEFRMPVSALGTGTFIIKLNETSFKIAIK